MHFEKGFETVEGNFMNLWEGLSYLGSKEANVFITNSDFVSKKIFVNKGLCHGCLLYILFAEILVAPNRSNRKIKTLTLILNRWLRVEDIILILLLVSSVTGSVNTLKSFSNIARAVHNADKTSIVT